MSEESDAQSPFRYHGLAVYSLVMGLLSPLWLWLGLPFGILGLLAVLAGLRARKEIDVFPGDLEGRRLATVGIVSGGVGFATALFVLLVLLTSPPPA